MFFAKCAIIFSFFTNILRSGADFYPYIVYSKNETDNCLEGTIEVTYYYALGTGREYEEVDFKKYTAGLDDLFNLKTEEELAEEAAEESNGEE